MTTERKEDYLKAIDRIVSGKGYAQVKDISRELDVGPSSVTGMLRKLTEDGCINYEKYGGVTLTPKGKEIADQTREKYGVIRDFLVSLGVDENIAEEDACKMEHIIAPETYEQFVRFCAFSKTEKGIRQTAHFKKFCKTGETEKCGCASAQHPIDL